MAGRRIFNEQDARRCLAAAETSRAGLAGWARAHGIDGRSLNLWRVNLNRRGATRQRAVGPRLIELVPAAAPLTVCAGPYLLHVSGVEFEVGSDFDDPLPHCRPPGCLGAFADSVSAPVRRLFAVYVGLSMLDAVLTWIVAGSDTLALGAFAVIARFEHSRVGLGLARAAVGCLPGSTRGGCGCCSATERPG